MQINTKYQYTYFLYPYIIDSKNYSTYLLRLLEDKKCKVKFFDKESDHDIYTHFMPNIKEFMFPSFYMSSNEKKEFYELSNEKKISILSKMNCTCFDYNYGDITYGKINDSDGIFFNIDKIQIMCFKSGACFILFRTHLDGTDSFLDLLKFNYKFRNVCPDMSSLEDFDRINLQSNSFSNLEEISELILNLTGNFKTTACDTFINRLFCYSYACIDSIYWNDTTNISDIEDNFYKYLCMVNPEDNSEFKNNYDTFKDVAYSRWKYSIYGFSKVSGVVFCACYFIF